MKHKKNTSDSDSLAAEAKEVGDLLVRVGEAGRFVLIVIAENNNLGLYTSAPDSDAHGIAQALRLMADKISPQKIIIGN